MAKSGQVPPAVKVAVCCIILALTGLCIYAVHAGNEDQRSLAEDVAYTAYRNSPKGQAEIAHDLAEDNAKRELQEEKRAQKLLNEAIDRSNAVPVRIVP